MLQNKLISLQKAVSQVQDGSHMAIGGFTMVRSPMAFIYEMIRQKKKDLHLYGHSPGIGWDILIGAGCVKRIEIAYESDGAFGNVGPMFKKAIQDKTIEWEDYSNFAMICRFMAGAMGLPCFPTRSLFGSDIVHLHGFSDELRQNINQIAKDKLHFMDCPFTHQKLALVPAINVDIAVIHAQQVGSDGTVRIYGQSFGDIQQALCAKKLIVTCEEIVNPDYLRAEPERNQIPFHRVTQVIHLPYGAHPCACNNYYDYDPHQFRLYHEKAKNPAAYQEYLHEFVYSVKTHDEYVNRIGQARLEEIKADSGLAYRADLKRR